LRAVVSEQAYLPYLIALAFVLPLGVAWLMLGAGFGLAAGIVAAVLAGGALFAIAASVLMFGRLKPALKRAVRQNLADRGLLALIVDTQSTDLPKSLHYMLRTSNLDVSTVSGNLCHRLRALIANYTQFCQLYGQWPVPRPLSKVLWIAGIVFYVLVGAIALSPFAAIGSLHSARWAPAFEVYLGAAFYVCIPMLTTLGWLVLLYQTILKRSVAEVVWEILGESAEHS